MFFYMKYAFNLFCGIIIAEILIGFFQKIIVFFVGGESFITLFLFGGLAILWLFPMALIVFCWFKLGQKWGPLWIISATALLLALLDDPALIYKAPAMIAIFGVLLALLGLKQYGMARVLQMFALLLARNAKAGTTKTKEPPRGGTKDFR